ncbi:ankyrin repeat-containing protein [Planoprotostelium fungivorum]|uniref:Ankyrin repeat-containing protein n=1 Tax=Planoprotostelium fungivorum TaxID=1890364 RepID=A0A2P6NBV5_9EUKA|nr:ankyrin repeat-containing protein [Planoprotostelium fungivorum]
MQNVLIPRRGSKSLYAVLCDALDTPIKDPTPSASLSNEIDFAPDSTKFSNQLAGEKVRRIIAETFKGLSHVRHRLMVRAKLSVEVTEARGLEHPNKKLCNPYCVIIWGSRKKKTKTLRKTNTPKWEESCFFQIQGDPSEVDNDLIVQICSHGLLSDMKLGTLTFAVEDLRNKSFVKPRWYSLTQCDGGEILLSATLQETSDSDDIFTPKASTSFTIYHSESASSIDSLTSSTSDNVDSPVSKHSPRFLSSETSTSRRGTAISLTPTESRARLTTRSSTRNFDYGEIINAENIIDYELLALHTFPCSLRGSGSGIVCLSQKSITFISRKKGMEKKNVENIVITMDEVTQISKTNVVLLVPNAIEVHTENRGVFSFLGFHQRDVIYRIMTVLMTNSKKKNTSLKGETPLFESVLRNDAAETKRLLQTTNDHDINLPDHLGFTVLHVCVSREMIDGAVLDLLLSFPGIDVNLKNKDGNTALHYFCRSYISPDDCQDLFSTFVRRGANVNAANSNGETPLHKAMFNNSIRLLLVELLLDCGAAINFVNQSGETALHYAARFGRKDLVHALVMRGADMSLRGTGQDKETAYELAVRWGYEDMASHIQRLSMLRDWLKNMELEKFFPLFVSEEMFLEECEYIDDSVLDRLNITSTGNRIKILRAAAQLGANKNGKSTAAGTEEDEKSATSSMHSSPGEEKNRDRLLTSSEERVTLKKQGEQNMVDVMVELQGSMSQWLEHSDIEFTKKLGSGTSGKVYQGLYEGKEVAIKVLKDIEQEETLDEFKKEFIMMRSIDSPHVVSFYGACLQPKLCIVMELCSRGSLYQVMMNRSMKMHWVMYFKLILDILNGMHFLHSHSPQIVHRDIKSPNFLVNSEWRVKVCDFGLSRFNTEGNKTTLSKICGTVAYLAPEVYTGDIFTYKADIFSLGIVLWEITHRLIEGKYLSPYSEYKFQFDWQILLAAQNNQKPTVPAKTPAIVTDIVSSCLETDPGVRPNTEMLLERIQAAYSQYKQNREAWDELLPTGEIEEGTKSSRNALSTSTMAMETLKMDDVRSSLGTKSSESSNDGR